MNSNPCYAVACRTDWFWDEWDKTSYSGSWLQIRSPEELTEKKLVEFAPRFVFFPHWSHRVPDSIVKEFECVCFHAAPVPYGRGGSPVQNMIVRGHEKTELVALRMTSQLDAGPVYLRRNMSLLGGGDEIFIRLAKLTVEMIEEMIEREPEPTEQSGEPVVFKRRQPEDSRLPQEGSLRDLFDLIRMLDAEGYPAAFVEYGDYRIEFCRPALRRCAVEADVRIFAKDDKDDRS